MSKLKNEQFSSLIDNLKRIEQRFTDQDRQFEIINQKFENYFDNLCLKSKTIENKLDKQDKSKWINNIIEPFSFSFIYRSISFYFSKHTTTDSIKELSSYVNKEKEEFKLSKLLIFWILITIIREFFDFYQHNKKNNFLSYKWLEKKNYGESLINLPLEINKSRNKLLLI
ncbi:MAG: GTP-binding protein EngB [Mycoplasmataceae bacterium]|nr:MAG: GTP-binding protein EngB [Mycoplasmataceae bacterium]